MDRGATANSGSSAGTISTSPNSSAPMAKAPNRARLFQKWRVSSTGCWDFVAGRGTAGQVHQVAKAMVCPAVMPPAFQPQIEGRDGGGGDDQSFNTHAEQEGAWSDAFVPGPVFRHDLVLCEAPAKRAMAGRESVSRLMHSRCTAAKARAVPSERRRAPLKCPPYCQRAETEWPA